VLKYVQDRHTIWYNELLKKAPADEGIREDKVKDEGGGEEINEKAGVMGQCIEIESRKEAKEMADVLKVKGMSCQHCVMSVAKALGKLEGVQNVKVDLQKGEVNFDNTKGVAQDRINKAIEEAGYEVISQNI